MSGEGQWKESISLEETNKIRVSLGLKPISDAPKPQQCDAESNFAKRKEDDQKERDVAALKAKIDKSRNARERVRKLVGIGLGEEEEGDGQGGQEDGGGTDAKDWVRKQKKRAKELAKKREKEQEEMDRRLAEEEETMGTRYGEQDLKGLKVAHGEEDFEEGEETILTLRDARVLDDEDDELHNLNISENAKTAEALALKKKGKQAGQYTGYDDDEFADGAVGSKKGVLNKYDEEIEGREEGGFRLGGEPVKAKKGKSAARMQDEKEEEREKVKLTMDYTKSFETDYMKEDEDVGFKKPKKKKKRPTRTTTLADEDESKADPAAMAVDDFATSTSRHQNLDETNLVDDDELQLSLARARREQNKKRIAEMKARAALAPAAAAASTSAMDVDGATRVKAESGDEDDDDDDDRRNGDIIVMDDTSEFVRNISLVAPTQRSNTNGVVKSEPVAPTPVPVIKKEPEDVPLSEVVGGWGAPREDGEESEEEGGVYDEDAAMRDVGEAEELKPKFEDGEDGLGSTAGEALVSNGLASTLSLLRNQGLIKGRTPEELARDKELKEKAAWLAEQKRRDRQREEEKRQARAAGSSKDQQQREYENRQREQREAQQAMELFNSYVPVVNLTYHDEFGRNQTPKEAWKQLSHNFHGIQPGHKKREKLLKKVEAERKAEAAGAGDTSALAFQLRAERMGSATMILSTGNRGAAPPSEETLNTAKSSKSKGKGKAVDKTSASTSTPVFSDIPMRALPLPSSDSRPQSPAVRAGFAPVRSFSPVTAMASAGGSETGTASPMEKIHIPMSVKRKAKDEVEGASPAKKNR